MGMSKQFRLGYKLGRLHGRAQYATEVSNLWNSYVQQLNDANSSTAQTLQEMDSEVGVRLESELKSNNLELKDLDEAMSEPANRKTRRSLRRQQKRWNKEQRR